MNRKIRSFSQLHTEVADRGRPVVTLFSGGLDSSYLLLRLLQYGVSEVHALSVNIGDHESTEAKQQIAEAMGATLHLVDARSEFAEKFVRPAILAHAVYLDTHPISSSLSRPLIAARAVALANDLGASTVLHTANRSQNTLRRINGAISDLEYFGSFGSPYDLDPVDRSQKVAALAAAGITGSAARLISGDSNLWCREYESGGLDDPESHDLGLAPFEWTRPDALAMSDDVAITFSQGIPVAVDGRPMGLVELIGELNSRVGRFGFGRYSGLEHLDGGQKVLEVREMPAAWIILRSRRHLELATLPENAVREKMALEQTWVTEALEGRWYRGLRESLDHFFAKLLDPIEGTVRWKLSPHSADTVSIVADRPLYVRDREQWERESIADERSHHLVPAPRPLVDAMVVT
ncbi:argininosuccinate synthase-related protein [Cellulomonas timonensis]|uniref:argininosuccinate synthase-related protein n=1 Tax=Cellulomonas timonensis TaxID=1689271 RepID=UPI000AC8E845|nr:argininosuccinate synthase-related protein [Cellulomonas timonensis]